MSEPGPYTDSGPGSPGRDETRPEPAKSAGRRSSPSVGVVGAGISGLTTARHLALRGVTVTLYEKQAQPGGMIRTRSSAGWQVDEGPNTLLVRSNRLRSLLRELGLAERMVEADPSASRYILREGRLHALPASPVALPGSGLFSAGAKLRLLKEPFVRRGEDADESVDSFVRRRLGPEVADYAADPFVGGIFAGDPKALVMRHAFRRIHELEQQYGSLLAGAIFGTGDSGDKADTGSTDSTAARSLVSFREGMEELPRALADTEGIDLLTGAEVTGLSRTRPGAEPQGRDPETAGPRWTVEYRHRGESHTRQHDAVVLACPPPAIARLTGTALPELPFAPVSVLATGFRREQVARTDLVDSGFGLLVPGKEPPSLLGTLFSSTLFPGRAPRGHLLLTSYIGGARSPELASLATDKIRDRVLEELTPLLGISGDPLFVSHTSWQPGIPQYTTEYGPFREALRELEERSPGLQCCGSFRGGVSLPDCIESAGETARRVLSFLDR